MADATQSWSLFELRPTGDNDAVFLEELDADVRRPELGLAGVSPAMLASLLAMQYKARNFGYATQYPEAQSQIVWIGEERAGRLLLNEDAECLRLVDIALLEKYRGHGIGTSVLTALRSRARKKGLTLRLAVRRDNPAQRLYQRMGFVPTGVDGVDLQMEWKA